MFPASESLGESEYKAASHDAMGHGLSNKIVARRYLLVKSHVAVQGCVFDIELPSPPSLVYIIVPPIPLSSSIQSNVVPFAQNI